ncbi:MFS transporter [Bordetella pertussis]|nr:MFS transporter [Bordetella pertussis]
MRPQNRWLVLAIIASALFLITVDTTVLYAALPRLTHDLHASAAEKLWIINAYPLVVTGLLPAMGALSDRWGPRATFTSGLAAFGAASLCVAYAPSATLLIVARGLLAIGAALMMPATLAILRHVFTDARERALAIGVWAAIASGGAALGPVVGGVLLEYFWWGSVFLINVPVVLALLWPAWRLVPAGQPAAHRPWDLGAAVLIMTALLGLVFGLKELGKPAPGYGVAMLAVAVGAVAMTLFARRQRGQAEPMIDVGMFRDAGFSRSVAVALIAMLTLVGVELVLSQRLQLVQGMTPLQAALLLLPVPLAAAAAGPLAGLWLGRAGERRVMGTALALAGVGAAGMVVGTEWPLAGQMAVLALLGAGLGGAMTAASTAVMLHAPADRASMAASIEEVAYELGSVLGVTLFGSIMTTVYTRTLVLPADAPAAAQLRDSLDQALAAAETMAPQWAQQVLPMAYQAFDHAYAVVAATAAALLAGAALLTQARRRGPQSSRNCML